MLHRVDVPAVPLERLAPTLAPGRAEELDRVAAAMRTRMAGRTVWNVSSTASGGGVAEMLHSLVAYARGAGLDTRWLVVEGDPGFFTVTKRLHNLLHGMPGDGGPLGETERRHYEEVLDRNLSELRALVRRGDIVLLHDPQTVGMAGGLAGAGVHVIWRCHVGRDSANAETDRAWSFLRADVERAAVAVFSRRQFVPPWLPPDRVRVIPPSLDPFSPKNAELAPDAVASVLQRAGLVDTGATGGDLGFPRADGSTGTTRAHQGLVTGGRAVPGAARVVLQVSRWDRLKDMSGVLTAFSKRVDVLPGDAHLVLAGPEVEGVADDPEGGEVLRECRQQWEALPLEVQERAHLVTLPMDDVEENAHLVNALQRHASVVAQKSLFEGFGLTVTEPMWKGRPVVASGIGGIQDQIEDGVHGLLLPDPYDLDGFVDRLRALLVDEPLAARLGSRARERVRERYLGDRHMLQYAELFGELLAAP